jgi:hypothetical protein
MRCRFPYLSCVGLEGPPRDEMCRLVWLGVEGGRPSASNGVTRRAWLHPRGRPFDQEVPTVVDGMRCPARLAVDGRVAHAPAVEGVVV